MVTLSLWQYCRDKPAVNYVNGDSIDFLRKSASFEFNKKVGKTDDNGTSNVEILVPLKYLSIF